MRHDRRTQRAHKSATVARISILYRRQYGRYTPRSGSFSTVSFPRLIILYTGRDIITRRRYCRARWRGDHATANTMRCNNRSSVQRLLNRALLLAVLLLSQRHTCAASSQQNTPAVAATAATTASVEDVAAATVVHKCCGPGDVISADKCLSTNNTKTAPWVPEFTESREDDAAAGPKTLPVSSVRYKWVKYLFVISRSPYWFDTRFIYYVKHYLTYYSHVWVYQV